eukprot:7703942-Alexandrium_andersonii.AAC.1
MLTYLCMPVHTSSPGLCPVPPRPTGPELLHVRAGRSSVRWGLLGFTGSQEMHEEKINIWSPQLRSII